MSQDTNDINRLATGKIGRLLWEYSVPAVVGMLVMSIYNVIDRIFIGQGVGTDAIAGLTITFPVMNISSAIGVLIGAGASARVSIMLGAKNKRGAELSLGNAMTLIIANAVVYISLMWIFLDWILIKFGASETSLPYARDFMTYILPGMMVMNVGYSLNSIMRASGYPVKAMVAMIISAVANVILAPIFIFVLDMGIKGAAIATDIAMTLFTIYVVAHFMNRKHNLHFTPDSFRLKRDIILAIIGIGAAPATINLASSFINAIINNNLLAFGGDNAVAAAGIFTTYTSLICMAVVGICQGMQPIVGYNYGAGHIDRLKRAFWLTVTCSTILVTAGAFFGLTTPHLIARAFTPDNELIAATSHGLSISMLCFFVVGFQIVSTTFFQSIGKVWQSITLSLARQVIFLIPLLLLMTRWFELDGVWMSFPLSDILATAVTAIMIYVQFRKIDKIPSKNRLNDEKTTK